LLVITSVVTAFTSLRTFASIARRVHVQRRCNVGVAQMGLHVFGVPVTLRFGCEGPPQHLKVDRHRDANSDRYWLNPTAQ
jgi:hypothetical protein